MQDAALFLLQNAMKNPDEVGAAELTCVRRVPEAPVSSGLCCASERGSDPIAFTVRR